MIETVTKISGNSTSTNKMRHNTAQLSQVEVRLLCVTHLLLNKVTTTKWMMSSRSFGQFVFFVSIVILNMFWKCNLMWWNSDSDLTKWKCGTGRKWQWQKEQHAKKNHRNEHHPFRVISAPSSLPRVPAAAGPQELSWPCFPLWQEEETWGI